MRRRVVKSLVSFVLTLLVLEALIRMTNLDYRWTQGGEAVT